MALIRVDIAGITVTTRIRSVSVESTYGNNITSCKLELVKKVEDDVTLAINQTVEIWRSFTGSITDPTDKKFNGTIETFETSGGNVTIKCNDVLKSLVDTEVTKVYVDTDKDAGLISNIFYDLVVAYGNLTMTSATLQNTTKTLDMFVCNDSSLYERCKKLAEIVDYQFYYRADTGYVYFEPTGYGVNSNTLIVGTHITEKPKWEEERMDMINKLTLRGAKQLVQTEEYFPSSSQTLLLINTPEDLIVLDGTTILKGGITSVTTSPDYTVDKINKLVTLDASPASTVTIRYSYNVPIPIRSSDDVSIATYGTKQKTITYLDTRNFDDAVTRVKSKVSKNKNPFVRARLKVAKHDTFGIKVGESIPISDAINTERNKNYNIFRFTQQWPLNFDLIEVGDRPFESPLYYASIEERLKRMEDEENRDIDIVPTLVQAGANITLARKTLNIYTNKLNDSFILGHADNGVLGRGEQLEEFNSGVGSWSASGGNIYSNTTQTIAGSASMGVIPTGTTVTITTTQSLGDLSRYSGLASGTPTSGMVGLWAYVISTADIVGAIVRIGSSASDYAEVIGRCYGESALDFAETGYNYILFPLTSATVTGTPDWTAVDYERFEIGTTGVEFILDYNTIGTGSVIALNGFGSRKSGDILKYTKTY